MGRGRGLGLGLEGDFFLGWILACFGFGSRIVLKNLFEVLFFFSRKKIEIYTDGSLKNGCGSWAYIILQNGLVIAEGSGRQKNTTSNRMEFQAAIEALQALPEKRTAKLPEKLPVKWLKKWPQKRAVILYTDSRILIEAVTVRIPQWKADGWVKKNDLPIHSLDQMKILDYLNANHVITWKWIRAHSGNEYNDRCDQLCTQARLKMKQ